jgi:amidase
MPTTPFPAPRAGLPLTELNPIRDAILCLCAHGGLAGHPQVSIPGAKLADGRPVGLSLLAARGADALLVGTGLSLEQASWK